MKEKRGQWNSRLGFILAAAGSAVGLGNIWKFPGKVGANGGGAFLLTYMIVVAIIGFTVMMAEFAIGRKTHKNAVGAFAMLNKKWKFAGVIGIVALFIILSYYAVVGGWVTKYVITYLTGAQFGNGSNAYATYFTNFITSPVEPILWDLLFLGVCIFIISKGVSAGIEKVSKVLMPGLFVLLIGIAIRSVTFPGADEGLRFMFTFRLEDLTSDMIVAAVGQAFFSLSVGMGILITYGSYLDKETDMVNSAKWICILDTFVAILAALAIIPSVFVTVGPDGLGMGGGFAFVALPHVFETLPGGIGHIFGLIFFVLLLLAALTSALSILESLVACVSEEFHISRKKSMAIMVIPLTLLSCGYSLSQLSTRGINLPWFDFSNGFQMLAMNAVMEKLTDNVLIPLGALAFCIFVGWVWKPQNAIAEIEQEGVTFPLKKAWSFSIRYIAPIAIIVILYFTVVKGIVLS
ncbi:MAG: sodium-dependent transporter [Longibaculum muris]|uniref:NSS family neurotransmitter:Na+ symporter n=1 Tax=Longibaculum muris TaxID=1796628 RepID=A0A4R3ZBT0_9FIRM|nr:sodium-dependent transporter [Longibaculum muris]KXU51845.1 Sodium:neurotransmitter symporter family protein [Candidatus Stoquefichus sp. KLE1796]MCR1887046.1 sodium-dependent transporter [Longibaculum muris]MED9811584.1 sodium-dependent transporter [Longibaculum muris]TCW03077.1 NSS family neurotransmitter:Na+ symporter [Longibaculum muris]